MKNEINTIKTQAEAQQYAIKWQNWASTQNLSYSELLYWQAIFEDLANKYPDIKDEFMENGIIGIDADLKVLDKIPY